MNWWISFYILYNHIWFHGGRITVRTCHKEGLFSDFSKIDLLTCDEKMLVIYTQKHM